MIRIFRLIKKLLSFFIEVYRKHWFAFPIGAVAAVISSTSAAAMMVPISSMLHFTLSRPKAIALNAVFGPLIAYLVYLGVYYFGMFLAERRQLNLDNGERCQIKLKNWFKVVKVDYLAHVPSDVYLISLAAIMQATLETSGMHIFMAVLLSQFTDDVVTFLKEPAIWGGAKKFVAWQEKAKS